MKKNLYLLLLILLFGIKLQGQPLQKTTYVDVIYFKDGTSVKGTVVYQVPKVRVSISRTNFRTQTDSVYTYSMANVLKIVKEPLNGTLQNPQAVSDRRLQAEGSAVPAASNNFPTTQSQSSLDRSDIPQMTGMMTDKMKMKPITQTVKADIPKPVYNEAPALVDGKETSSDEMDLNALYKRANERKYGWYRSITGLRMLIDYGYIQGIGNIKNNRFEWATSLGFQFDPIFYLGMGASYSFTLNKKESSVPIFINPRINFLDNNVTPFLDLKVGYSALEAKGWYINPNVGVSFAMKGTQAFSIGMGYSFQQAKYKKWSEEENKRIRFKDVYNGLQLKLTYEFNIYTIK